MQVDAYGRPPIGLEDWLEHNRDIAVRSASSRRNAGRQPQIDPHGPDSDLIDALRGIAAGLLQWDPKQRALMLCLETDRPETCKHGTPMADHQMPWDVCQDCAEDLEDMRHDEIMDREPAVSADERMEGAKPR